MNKRVFIGYTIWIIVICLFIINIVILQKTKTTAFATNDASVNLSVQKVVTIYSPSNTTYNFNLSDNYTLSLNVSANFNVSNWSFTLWDLRNDTLVNDSVTFTPNTTFNAVRWSNYLNVSATSAIDSETQTANVTFYINITDSAPILYGINSTIYSCENTLLSYNFIANDLDEEALELSITPTEIFFLTPLLTSGSINTTIELFGIPNKTNAGGVNNGYQIHSRNILVSDGKYTDSAQTNITVIEINNAPVLQTIGVQTVQTQGDNSTLYKQIQVTDTEDGNQDSVNISFNISFSSENLFNITNNGIINFTPNSSQVGTYNVTVCTTDSGIDNPHPNISTECGQDGGNLSDCETFELTVTDENRVPNITSYNPTNLTLNVLGTETLSFNITKTDPDGTTPDTYWYVDTVLQEIDTGNSTDTFSYSFGCGVSGTGTIKAEITDGSLNDSIQWNITYSLVNCPTPTQGVVGGGAGVVGVIKICEEKWACSEWNVCKNAKDVLEAGVVSGEEYRTIKEKCELLRLNEQSCGIQIRGCFDINKCGTFESRPYEFQSCHYTKDPNCEDRIKNCHDGSCELLADCGGPCPPCPTCSDGVQNQNEKGIDCGGPCPWGCERDEELLLAPENAKKTIYFLIIFFLLALVLIIIKFKRIQEYVRKLRGV